jgi:hypothetical protein
MLAANRSDFADLDVSLAAGLRLATDRSAPIVEHTEEAALHREGFSAKTVTRRRRPSGGHPKESHQ